MRKFVIDFSGVSLKEALETALRHVDDFRVTPSGLVGEGFSMYLGYEPFPQRWVSKIQYVMRMLKFAKMITGKPRIHIYW